MTTTAHSNKDVRLLETSDVEHLASFQINKNRSYIQLKPGILKAHYAELNLSDVQIFQEQLNVGARIQAAPASHFLPFSVISSANTRGNYCGQILKKNTMIQATGGMWDINFSNHIDYICTAFDRESLTKKIRQLTGEDIPKSWLQSKAITSDPVALKRYSLGTKRVMHLIQHNPELLNHHSVYRILNEVIFKLTLDILEPNHEDNGELKSQPLRVKAVQHVIEYIDCYAEKLPTLADLCEVAKMSERSLQYGFKEYLGMTPCRYLRTVRLNRVHNDLKVACHPEQKVVDIALQWGFLELGRFAGEYQFFYQELPSETLRKPY